MEIAIIKNDTALLAVCKYETLFQFEYREDEIMGGPAWYFWLYGNHNPNIFPGEKKDFPMEFFKDACRALAFVHRVGQLNEEITIIAGEKYLL